MNLSKHSATLMATFLAASFLLPLNLFSQLTTATVSGTISDQTGAVVPSATVTAVNESTGNVTQAVSNDQGFYVLGRLLPGSYKLQVRKAGFRNYVRQDVQVEVGVPVTVAITLQVGSNTQTVTVSASAVKANVRSQSISYVVNTQMAKELPLNGRNVLQLMQLAPDTGPTTSSGYQQNASRPENADLYVGASGGRGNSTVFYLDGAINEDALTEIANIFPNPDAIQEFSFVTNNYSARFAGRGGGVVNAVTRGGTNEFHGDLFEFMRNSALNARNFFAPTEDGLKRNQYGGTVGGPIRKNKTFFFFSFQRTNVRQTPADNSAVTPTAKMRMGDFSEISTQLVDPSTGNPFPGNQVPSSMLDPIATKVLSWVPVGAPGTGIVYYPSRLEQNDNQFVTRVDDNIGDKLRIYASYLYDKLNQPSTTLDDNALTATPTQSWTSNNFVLNTTYVFRPNLIGTFVASASRRSNLAIGQKTFPDWPDIGVNMPKIVTAGSASSLALSLSNYFGLSWTAYYTIPATEGGLATHWSYIQGNHEVEFGGSVIQTKEIKDQDYLGDGSFKFSGRLSGDNALDFMLGVPSSFTQRNNYYYVPFRTLPATYISDTWKISRRLTLDLGLRWNPFVSLHDSSAYHQMGIFSYDLYNQGVHSSLYPNVAPGILLSGDPGVSDSIVPSDYKIFTPRVGVALDPFGDGKTSIRSGYGIYIDQQAGNTLNPGYSPFVVNATFSYPYSLADPYQGEIDPFPVPQPVPSNTVFPLPMTASPYTPNMRASYIQQWNFTVERQLPWDTLLRAAYEGEASDHLPGSIEGNAAVYDPTLSASDNRKSTSARRPMAPEWGALALAQNVGVSSFNALVLSVEKRTAHGLTFLGGYRWSKCLDNLDETQASYTHNSYTSTFPAFDKGPCGYDVPQEFHFAYSWAMPTIQSIGSFGRHIFGGWETNGILTLRSGLPFTVFSGVDNSFSGIGNDRADIVGNPALSGSRSRGDQLKEWFNTSAFAENAYGMFGTSERNGFEGPGFSNFDFSLVRSFPIRIGPRAEGQRLQFRAEFFNLFNRPNFDSPVSSVTSKSFGRILSGGDPRILQFGMKFVF